MLGEGEALDPFGVTEGEVLALVLVLVLMVVERMRFCPTGCDAEYPTPLGGRIFSGNGSALKTSSKRVRLKLVNVLNPSYAGVVSRNVTRLALSELCLKGSKFKR
jgi:hypothetical protein